MKGCFVMIKEAYEAGANEAQRTIKIKGQSTEQKGNIIGWGLGDQPSRYLGPQG